MIDVIRTPSVAETINYEINFILSKYEKLLDTAELEKNLRGSFKNVQEATEQETLKVTDGWICGFCDEISTGRDKEEAGVAECDICGTICCNNCMDNDHFIKWESGYLCIECDDKVNSAMEKEESDKFVYD